MQSLSNTEENYIKGLFQLTIEVGNKTEAGTNEIANHLGIKPASVNDMLKKLKDKKLIQYEKYGKSSLTKEGKKLAVDIVRKHRLWETFLFEKLAFSWDEVHEVAEQLEHIQSKKLIDKLDQFLNYPSADPHGDPIPNAKGELVIEARKSLVTEEVGHTCKMVGVKDNSASFLQYADSLGLAINQRIKIKSRQAYDDLIEIEVKGRNLLTGIPELITISSSDIREALSECVTTIVEAVRNLLERTPPELSADIFDRGILLSGGGALLKGIDRRLQEETSLPVHIAEDPLTAVVRGTGRVLENLSEYQNVLIKSKRY